jgi:hypothetical protein
MSVARRSRFRALLNAMKQTSAMHRAQACAACTKAAKFVYQSQIANERMDSRSATSPTTSHIRL